MFLSGSLFSSDFIIPPSSEALGEPAGAGFSREQELSASATKAKPEVSRNRSRRREPRLDRRVLNMEFKGGKKPTPNPSPCTCSSQRSPHCKGWLRGRAGITQSCCRRWRRVRSRQGDSLGGTWGAGPPQPTGGGRRVGELRKSRSHMSPLWHSSGRGCHSTTPPKVGGPPTQPQLNALPGSASCTGLAPVRRATCQNHFLNQTTTGGGMATRGPRAPDRALPLLPNSGRAP